MKFTLICWGLGFVLILVSASMSQSVSPDANTTLAAVTAWVGIALFALPPAKWIFFRH